MLFQIHFLRHFDLKAGMTWFVFDAELLVKIKVNAKNFRLYQGWFETWQETVNFQSASLIQVLGYICNLSTVWQRSNCKYLSQ